MVNLFGNSDKPLQSFAKKHNLRVQFDDCGDPVTLGTRGHLYEYGPIELGLMILSGDDPSSRFWNAVRPKCISAGMTLRQNGEAEGAFSFDPENKDHARLAIKLTGVRPKKKISDSHKAKLLSGLRDYRNFRPEAILEGLL
jgi:hypothetical protein